MYNIATDDLPLNSKVNIAQLFEFADEVFFVVLAEETRHSKTVSLRVRAESRDRVIVFRLHRVGNFYVEGDCICGRRNFLHALRVEAEQLQKRFDSVFADGVGDPVLEQINFGARNFVVRENFFADEIFKGVAAVRNFVIAVVVVRDETTERSLLRVVEFLIKFAFA